jgi:uncharacterized RDD family membrane protein YckC
VSTELLQCLNHPDGESPVTRCQRCLAPYCSDCLVMIQGRPYCGLCKHEFVRDVASGVSLSGLELAGIGRRFAAIIIDSLIVSVPVFLLVMVGAMAAAMIAPSNGPMDDSTSIITSIAVGGTMLLGFVVSILYEPLQLTRSGQTIGKKMMGIRVVRPDGTAISAGQAWGRFGLRSILGIIDYIPIFFTEERTCVHDMLANTRVINDR